MWRETGWRMVTSEGGSIGLGIIVSVGVSGGSFFLEHESGYHLRLVYIYGQRSYGLSPLPLQGSLSTQGMYCVPGDVLGWNRHALYGRDFEGDFSMAGEEASLVYGPSTVVLMFGIGGPGGHAKAMCRFTGTSAGIQAGASFDAGYGRVIEVISGQGHLPREYLAEARAGR
jgi:hypothetical protein